VGDSVTWTNNDGFGHTATTKGGAPEAFDSGTLSGGKQFSRTFTLPGTYNYQCNIHGASMSGSITVMGPAAANAPAAVDNSGPAPSAVSTDASSGSVPDAPATDDTAPTD